MKKYLVVAILMVCLMIGSCTTLSNLFCKADENQQTQAQQYLASAQAAINALTPMIGSVPQAQAAVVALNLAIPIFNSVIAGTCVAVTQWQDATKAVPAADNVAMAMGITDQLNQARALKGLAPVK